MGRDIPYVPSMKVVNKISKICLQNLINFICKKLIAGQNVPLTLKCIMNNVLTITPFICKLGDLFLYSCTQENMCELLGLEFNNSKNLLR